MIGKPERAVKLASQAVEMDPLNLGGLLGLGEILYRSNRFEAAIEVLESLLERFPGNKVAESILGAAYYHGGHKEKAQQFYLNRPFEEKITIFYALPQFYYLIENGEQEATKKILTISSLKDSDKWISPICKAMVYFGLGALDTAETLTHQALTERDPILWIVQSEPTWKAFREHPRIKTIFEERFIPRSDSN